MVVKKRKRRVVEKTVTPVIQPEPTIIEAPIETCFYCRESKYEPSITRCPVPSHTKGH